MKNGILMLLLALLMLNAHAFAQPLYVDLSTLLDADVFLEADGTPIGDPLDEKTPVSMRNGRKLSGWQPCYHSGRQNSFLFAP